MPRARQLQDEQTGALSAAGPGLGPGIPCAWVLADAGWPQPQGVAARAPWRPGHRARASPCHRQYSLSVLLQPPCPQQAWAGGHLENRTKPASGPSARAAQQAPRWGRATPISASVVSSLQNTLANGVPSPNHQIWAENHCARGPHTGPPRRQGVRETWPWASPNPEPAWRRPGPRAPGTSGDGTRGLPPAEDSPRPRGGRYNSSYSSKIVHHSAPASGPNLTHRTLHWKHRRSPWRFGPVTTL